MCLKTYLCGMKAQSTRLTYADLSELDRVADQLIELGGGVPVWLFFGQMGAGKTTLIKKICEKLGVNGIVQSPTFSIVNEYTTQARKTIYHFDLYRLKNETEAYDIGVEEYLYSGNYCFFEWPEKIESLWPDEYLEIQIVQIAGGNRTIQARLFE